MVVVRQRLHPTIASLHRKAAHKALGGEHLVPVGLAVRLALLQEERTVAEQFATVRARETLWMEVLADGVQAITLQILGEALSDQIVSTHGTRLSAPHHSP